MFSVPREVTRRELRGGARVDDQRAALEERGNAGLGDLVWAAHSVEEPRTLLVDPLHLREVRWRLGLPGEHLAHEHVLVLDLERPVGDLLVAERRRGHRAERLPAGRAGAVAGPELEVIRERGE